MDLIFLPWDQDMAFPLEKKSAKMHERIES